MSLSQHCRPVAVTGLGVVSSIGCGQVPFWSSIQRGQCGIAELRSVDTSTLSFKKGAECYTLQEPNQVRRSCATKLDRFAQLALIAGLQAVDDAGVEWTENLRCRTAVIIGSSTGGQTSEDEQFRRLYASGAKKVHPLTVPRVMANSASSLLSMQLGLTGPTLTLSTACSSANHAIGLGLWMIRSGLVDLALVGGSDAPFSLGNLKAWDALGVISTDTCRPFSKDRSGTILGEGAAVLLLEPLKAATKRDVRIYARLRGFGMSSDAYHLTRPNVRGPVMAMQAALQDARLNPNDFDHQYINAHGTATIENDNCEINAIRTIFSESYKRIAVSSTKSMHGHALGAAGGIEGVATTLAIYRGTVPPTANFTEPDDEFNLDLVTHEARAMPIKFGMSNSFAFGGLNAVLIFESHG